MLCKDVVVDIECPECGKVIAQPSALNLHMKNKHGKTYTGACFNAWKAEKGEILHFHCPVNSCKYQENADRFFKTFAYLKQHYMKVHAPCSWKCEHCSEGFALQRFLRSHLKKCKTRKQKEQKEDNQRVPPDTLQSSTLPVQLEVPVTNCEQQTVTEDEEDRVVGAYVDVHEKNECMSYTEDHAYSQLRNRNHNATIHCKDTLSNTKAPILEGPNDSEMIFSNDSRNREGNGYQQCKSLGQNYINQDQGPNALTNSLGKCVQRDGNIPNILPKPNIILIPARIQNNVLMPMLDRVLMVSDTRTCLESKPRQLAPKPMAKPPPRKLQRNVVKQTESLRNMEMRQNAEIQTDRSSLMNKTLSSASIQVTDRNTSSTQTSKQQALNEVQTQTTGDRILLKAMESAEIPIEKESRSSQVSPRTKSRHALKEMTTQTTPHKTPENRRKRRLLQQSDFTVNTELPWHGDIPAKRSKLNTERSDFSMNTDTPVKESRGMQHGIAGGSDQSTHTSVQVDIDRNEGENMSTQTLESFLAQDSVPTLQLPAVPKNINKPVMNSVSLQTAANSHVSTFNRNNVGRSDTCDDVPFSGILSPKHFKLPKQRKRALGKTLKSSLSKSHLSPRKVSEEELATASSSSTSYYKVVKARQNVAKRHSPEKQSSSSTSCTTSTSPIPYVHTSTISNPQSSSPTRSLYRTTNTSTESFTDMCTNTDLLDEDYSHTHVQTEFDPILPLTSDISTEMEGLLSSATTQTHDMSTGGFDLPIFLDTDTQTQSIGLMHNNTQTADTGDGFSHTETQTHHPSTQGDIQTQTSVEDLLLDQLWIHMETQTSADDFLAGLGLVDIETQTSVPSMSMLRSQPLSSSINTVQTQTSRSENAVLNASVASTNIQTQTLFDPMTFGTDSQTQTTWQSFQSLFE